MPDPFDRSNFPPDYTITVSRHKAILLGIVRCKHCGYPPNNHFSHPPFTCAHAACPGYEEIVLV